MPTRLLIADDHTLVRQGVRQLLADAFLDFEFAEAAGLDAALQVLSAGPIDLVLMDLGMPGMAGADSLRALREAYPSVKIIVVTGIEERVSILNCLAAGAHGYVLKSLPVEEIVRAVRMVLAGDIYAASAVATLSADPVRTPSASQAQSTAQAQSSAQSQNPAQIQVPGQAHAQGRPAVSVDTSRFTTRQVQVLQLLAQGRSTKDIARTLELGPGTVKIHLAAIYRRLNAHNRTEAVVLASKLDL